MGVRQPRSAVDSPPIERASAGVPRLVLPALLLLAGLVRLFSWLGSAAMFNDGPLFLELAGELASGNWSSALRHPYHPLYPLATAAVHAVWPDWEAAGVCVSIAAGIASVGFLYAFVRRAFGAGAAAIAGLMLAVHPYAVRFSADVLSDGLYLACFLAAVAAFWAALEERRLVLGAWAGLAAGLAYLARPEGLGVVAAAGLFLAIEWLRRRMPLARALPLGAAVAAGLLLVMAPYVGLLRAETGVWRLTQKKSVKDISGVDLPQPVKEWVRGDYVLGAEVENPPNWDELESDARPEEIAGALRGAEQDAEVESRAFGSEVALPGFRRYEPPAVGDVGAHLGALREIVHTAQSALRPELALLLVLGLFGARGMPGRRGWWVLAVIAVYAAAIFLLRFNAGYVSRRHVLPPLTLTLGWAALGVTLLAGWIQARLPAASSARGFRFAVAGVLLLVTLLGVGKALRPSELDHVATRRAAEWFRAQELEAGLLAAQKRRWAWYAEAPFFPLRAAPEAELVPYLREHGVRYVIAEFDGHGGLEAAVAQEDLRVLHREEAGGHRVGVFELAGGSPPPTGSGGD